MRSQRASGSLDVASCVCNLVWSYILACLLRISLRTRLPHAPACVLGTVGNAFAFARSGQLGRVESPFIILAVVLHKLLSQLYPTTSCSSSPRVCSPHMSSSHLAVGTYEQKHGRNVVNIESSIMHHNYGSGARPMQVRIKVRRRSCPCGCCVQFYVGCCGTRQDTCVTTAHCALDVVQRVALVLRWCNLFVPLLLVRFVCVWALLGFRSVFDKHVCWSLFSCAVISFIELFLASMWMTF